jgi:hypothetical protein
MKKRSLLYTLVALLASASFGLAGFSPAPQPADLQIEIADCAADHFIEVGRGATNSQYPDPLLEVSCDGETATIRTNNIPNFAFVQTTPNALQAQDYTITIPQNPVVADETTAVPLVGISAIAVNGLLIFGPTEAPQDGSRDPYLDQILDDCNGHTAQQGNYHFHARPDCIFETIDGQVGLVIAYALDGFPILAPYLCVDAACTQTVEVASSWQLTNPAVDAAWEQHSYVAGSGDLDACNGMFLDDSSYVYFATDTFPYFMGCYVGEVGLNGNALGGNAAGGQNAGVLGGLLNGLLGGGQAGGAPQGGPPQGAPPAGGAPRP